MEKSPDVRGMESSPPPSGLVITIPPQFAGDSHRTIIIPSDEFHWQFTRSSGPGGQNVNKLSTKAILRWNPDRSRDLPGDVRNRLITMGRHWRTQQGDLVISSQKHRQQQRNIDDCLQKLHDLISAAARRSKPRKKTRPSRASKERRLAAKRHQSQRKAQRRLHDD